MASSRFNSLRGRSHRACAAGSWCQALNVEKLNFVLSPRSMRARRKRSGGASPVPMVVRKYAWLLLFANDPQPQPERDMAEADDVILPGTIKMPSAAAAAPC